MLSLWPLLYSTMQLHKPGLMETIIITVINVVVVVKLLRRSIDATKITTVSTWLETSKRTDRVQVYMHEKCVILNGVHLGFLIG